jgi:hypothetical protein
MCVYIDFFFKFSVMQLHTTDNDDYYNDNVAM